MPIILGGEYGSSDGRLKVSVSNGGKLELIHHQHSVGRPAPTTGDRISVIKIIYIKHSRRVQRYNRRPSSVVVCNAAGVRSGRPPGAWTVGAPAAGRVSGWAADTARRASTVTSPKGDTLFTYNRTTGPAVQHAHIPLPRQPHRPSSGTHAM